jgi:diguanylate cyclase (GGDEF)-like protein
MPGEGGGSPEDQPAPTGDGPLSARERPRIGLSDDERLGRESLGMVLRAAGYEAETFDGAPRLLERAAESGFDLVLLDVMMPRMSGLEACRLLKGTTQAAGLFVPVVLLSGRADVKARSEGIRMGADDFLAKPYDPQELLARIGALLRIKRQYDDVAAQRARLLRLCQHDELTELFTPRSMRQRVLEEFHRAERYHDPLAYVAIDVDGLDAVNAEHGRAAGDHVLRALARALRGAVRDIDPVGRTGADEFAVLLPSTQFAGATAVAERIAATVQAQRIDVGGRVVSLTVSVGVGLFPSRDVRTKDELVRAAESALRHAKRLGRGQVCVLQQHGFVYVAVREAGAPPLPRAGHGS